MSSLGSSVPLGEHIEEPRGIRDNLSCVLKGQVLLASGLPNVDGSAKGLLQGQLATPVGWIVMPTARAVRALFGDSHVAGSRARAWAVMEYFTTKQNLDKERFSISQTSSLGRGNAGRSQMRSDSERTLEVVFLERSIYD